MQLDCIKEGLARNSVGESGCGMITTDEKPIVMEIVWFVGEFAVVAVFFSRAKNLFKSRFTIISDCLRENGQLLSLSLIFIAVAGTGVESDCILYIQFKNHFIIIS